MTMGHYHALCNRHMGRAVEIRTRDGAVHRGIIRHVTPNRVHLEPFGARRGGFGYGFGGFGYGWGFGGFGLGIALGFIVGFSLLFWW